MKKKDEYKIFDSEIMELLKKLGKITYDFGTKEKNIHESDKRTIVCIASKKLFKTSLFLKLLDIKPENREEAYEFLLHDLKEIVFSDLVKFEKEENKFIKI